MLTAMPEEIVNHLNTNDGELKGQCSPYLHSKTSSLALTRLNSWRLKVSIYVWRKLEYYPTPHLSRMVSSYILLTSCPTVYQKSILVLSFTPAMSFPSTYRRMSWDWLMVLASRASGCLFGHPNL